MDVITGSVSLAKGAETDAANTSAYMYTRSTAAEQARLCAASRARGGRCRSVMADVWLCYDDLVGDNARLQLLSPEDAVAELLAPLEGGADGLLIWGVLDKNRSVLDPTSVPAMSEYLSAVAAPIAAAICGNYSCCSSYP